MSLLLTAFGIALAAPACSEDPTGLSIGLAIFGTVRSTSGTPIQGAVVRFRLLPAAQQDQCAEPFTDPSLPSVATDGSGSYRRDIVIRGAVSTGEYCLAVRVDPPPGANFTTAFALRTGLNLVTGARPLQQVRVDVVLPDRPVDVPGPPDAAAAGVAYQGKAARTTTRPA